MGASKNKRTTCNKWPNEHGAEEALKHPVQGQGTKGVQDKSFEGVPAVRLEREANKEKDKANVKCKTTDKANVKCKVDKK